MILQLRVCGNCGLKYRFPKDDPSYAEFFYESRYWEPTVTDLPSPEEMHSLITSGFKGSIYDKSDKVEFVVSRLGKNTQEARLLDYGASFGYLMAQMRLHGIKHILGYEISKGRARFGVESLGLEILSDRDEMLSHPCCPFDAILASHVLEHLARLDETLDFFSKIIKRPGGHLFIWVPNASQPALDRFHNGSWAALVGEPHTLALDYDFFGYALPRHGFRIIERGEPWEAEIKLIAEAI